MFNLNLQFDWYQLTVKSFYFKVITSQITEVPEMTNKKINEIPGNYTPVSFSDSKYINVALSLYNTYPQGFLCASFIDLPGHLFVEVPTLGNS